MAIAGTLTRGNRQAPESRRGSHNPDDARPEVPATVCYNAVHRLLYSASISPANRSVTTFRFTFSVGVNSPVSTVKSIGRIWNLRIDSACDTDWLDW